MVASIGTHNSDVGALFVSEGQAKRDRSRHFISLHGEYQYLHYIIEALG